MSAPSIQFELWLGRALARPAGAAVMNQLKSAEIVRRADGPGRFSLVFRLDRDTGAMADFGLLSDGSVDPWNRVVCMVRLGAARTILIDGFITAQQLVHDTASGAAQLTVSGEDVSIAMDRLQLSLEYPQMGDAAIAALVLVKYAAIGVVPEIVPPPMDLAPSELERTPQQNDTDRAFLCQLACRNGYQFTIKPGPEPLMNTAYWGPPLNIGEVAPALSVDLGAATNVENVTFSLDAAAPVQMFGMVQDSVTEFDLPLATLIGSRLPPLATTPMFDPVGVMQRREIFTDPRMGYLQAMNAAQVRTDTSSQAALKVSGELDTLRYGAVLAAPGLVALRGAGSSYDGRYRVDQVTHRLALGQYRQAFELAREGTGSTVSRVAA